MKFWAGINGIKMRLIKDKLYSVLLALFIINAFYLPCSAKDNTDEEKQFTEVKNIGSGQVKTLENKTYDDEITIKEIFVSGNNLVDTDKILQQLNIKSGSKFNRNEVQENLKNIYKMGYFTEKIKAVPKQTSSGITLYIQVEENSPVTGFNVSGNKAVSAAEIQKILSNQEGLPQNIVELNNSIQEIEKLYADKGYVLARVTRISDDPDGVINIELNEGKINSVNISGNTKTKDYVIKRNITAQPGDVYNENLIRQDIARLFGSQSFSDVRRVISASPDDADKYDLTIEVDEKRTGSISLGGGVDTQTGFFGTAGYSDKNLMGRGQELNVNFTLGSGVLIEDNDVIDKAPLQFEANFIEPRLKNTLNSLRVTAFGRDMASYQIPLAIEKRFGGEIELARPVKKVPHLAASVSMGVEKTSMKEGDSDKIKERFDEKGYTDAFRIDERANELEGGTYLTFNPGLVYDSRNSILNPTEGWYASTMFNEAFNVSGDAGSYGKVSTAVRKFIPVGDSSTLILGGKMASRVVGDMPEFAAFRLGGAYSVRGFREGDAGNGKGFMLATTEFRTPIPYIDRVAKYKFIRDIRVAAFADAGKLFKKSFVSTLYNRPGYGVSVGGGLLVPVPFLGIIRVDYGYPITNVGIGNKRGSFSFGVGDRY